MDQKTNWKYILIVLILTLIAAGGTIACKKNLIKELTSLVKFLETSKAGKVLDTSSWKTCRNEEYGFEFKYPNDWHQENPFDFSFLAKDGKKLYFGIKVFNQALRPNSYSLEEWLKERPIGNGERKDIMIGSEKGLLQYSLDCNTEEGTACVFGIDFVSEELLKNGLAFSLGFDVNPDEVSYQGIGSIITKGQAQKIYTKYQKEIQIISQILSTFKFIEPAKQEGLLKVCPEEWIINKMPLVDNGDFPREYYIYQGVRRELSEFDAEWVKASCGLTPQYVF